MMPAKRNQIVPQRLIRNILRKNAGLLVIAGFLAALPATAPAATEKASQSEIVARVNGVNISGERLAATVASRIAKYQQMGASLPEGNLKRQIQLKELDTLITQELLAQAGASVDPKEVEQRLEKRLTSNPPGAKDENRDRLLAEIRQQILIEQKILKDLTVGEQEKRDFYDKSPQNFVQSRSMKAQHILIRIPANTTSGQEQEARRKAEGILAELKAGKDFAEAARTLSDCASKENGGDLGLIKEGYMPREFDEAASKLKPGELSEIVKTRYGFHILRVTEHIPARQMSFEEVSGYIEGYLKIEKQRKKMDEFVQQLKKSAKIEILI